MKTIGIKTIPTHLKSIETPECQTFPQWRKSELTSKGLPDLTDQEMEKQRAAGKSPFPRMW
jgi:hypothetical protein